MWAMLVKRLWSKSREEWVEKSVEKLGELKMEIARKSLLTDTKNPNILSSKTECLPIKILSPPNLTSKILISKLPGPKKLPQNPNKKYHNFPSLQSNKNSLTERKQSSWPLISQSVFALLNLQQRNFAAGVTPTLATRKGAVPLVLDFFWFFRRFSLAKNMHFKQTLKVQGIGQLIMQRDLNVAFLVRFVEFGEISEESEKRSLMCAMYGKTLKCSFCGLNNNNQKLVTEQKNDILSMLCRKCFDLEWLRLEIWFKGW